MVFGSLSQSPCEQPEIPNRFSRQSCLGSRVLGNSLPHNRGTIVSVLIYKIAVDSLESRMFIHWWDQSTIGIIKIIWPCLAPILENMSWVVCRLGFSILPDPECHVSSLVQTSLVQSSSTLNHLGTQAAPAIVN